MTIDPMKASDWEQVRSIYLEGLSSGNSTFETEAPSWEQWDEGHLQFARLVMRNQLLVFGAIVVQEITDRSLPPELRNYLGIDNSVLNTQITSVAPLSNVPYWLGTVNIMVGLVASVGLCFGQAWGRSLYLLTFLMALIITLFTDFYVTTGWTAFVSYLVGTTEGMILALAYFSHLKRMFQDSGEE